MADRTQDIIYIAERVNRMTDFEIRQRIKELENVDLNNFYLEDLMEIQFLALKILSIAKNKLTTR